MGLRMVALQAGSAVAAGGSGSEFWDLVAIRDEGESVKDEPMITERCYDGHSPLVRAAL
jgi:hypothetical protein